MSHHLGKDAKLYRNTGTNASPTWNEIIGVMDLAMDFSKAKADLTGRDSGGFRMSGGTIIDAVINFGMIYDTDDADFDALRAAYFANTQIQYAVMDGDIALSGQEGFRAFCEIIGFDIGQELEDGIKVDISLEPCRTLESGSIVVPDWYEVP